jgi:carboxypeptidase Q
MASHLFLVNAATGTTLPPMPDAVGRIAGAVLTRGGAFGFLQALTDTIGPRLTGTDNSRRAADLLVHTMSQAGLENVHIEEYQLPSTWRRGTASGRLVAPVLHDLRVQSHGWAPSIHLLDAPLLDLGALVPGDLTPPMSHVRGSVVLADFPDRAGEFGYLNRARSAPLLAEAGAAALLIPSGKPSRLLDVTCFGNLPAAALPMLSIAQEDTLLLRRLLATGPVRLALTVENTLERTPAAERNVIAEWRGSSRPEEIIIVAAHFDSWDTGTGANDDGTGVAAIVETARVLAALDLRPMRTIRFVLFSGEEQGLLGSRAYVVAHGVELDCIKTVIVMDQGAGAPRGFKLHGRQDVAGAAARVIAPLHALDAAGLSQEARFDQDHAFFLAAGIPVMTLWVQPGEYDVHRHAMTDTLDKIDPRMLTIDTAVMAVAAFCVADGEAIGPRLGADASAALLRDTGLESAFNLLRVATDPVSFRA